MLDYYADHVMQSLDDVLWEEDTDFSNLQWYYAGWGLFLLRVNSGQLDEFLCIIRAKSAKDAISRIV